MGTVHNIVSDAEFDQLDDHVIDVAKRTHAKLVDHYRPFLEGRVPPKMVDRYLRGAIGGAFTSIGLHELKACGLTLDDIIAKITASWAEADAPDTSTTEPKP
jgi:hypothetical protein